MHCQGIIHIDPKGKPLIPTHTSWINLCQLLNKKSKKDRLRSYSHHKFSLFSILSETDSRQSAIYDIGMSSAKILSMFLAF